MEYSTMMLRRALAVVTLVLTGTATGQAKKEAPKFNVEDFQKFPNEAKAVLENAGRYELLSLHPSQSELKKGDEEFQGWKVLGKTAAKDSGDRKKVRKAIEKGVAESYGVGGCFKPRHGLRAVHKDKTVELVICFECMSIAVSIQEKGGDPKGASLWTTATPKPVLDKILRDAKVPLPPGPDNK